MGKCELLYEGKVREVYDCDDKLVMVATDRISAFDHILKNKVTEKGAILTQMSKFWFDFTHLAIQKQCQILSPACCF